MLTLTLPWVFKPSLQTCARSHSKIGGKNDCFEVGLSNILSFPWRQLKICMTGPLVVSCLSPHWKKQIEWSQNSRKPQSANSLWEELTKALVPKVSVIVLTLIFSSMGSFNSFTSEFSCSWISLEWTLWFWNAPII